MKEWRVRGYLPHRDKIGLKQHITFSLFDSLPQHVKERIKNELTILKQNLEIGNYSDDKLKEKIAYEKLKQIHNNLDKGYGACYLKNNIAANIVKNALLKFDDEKYNLLAWCIMPNHVHVLIKTKIPLDKIVHSWKSFTSKEIIKKLSLNINTFWQVEYHDRYIRDEKHYNLCKTYIEENPLKAGLVNNAKDWLFSSLK